MTSNAALTRAFASLLVIVGLLFGFVVGFVGLGAPWLFLAMAVAVVMAAKSRRFRSTAVALAAGVVAGVAFLFFAGATDIFERV